MKLITDTDYNPAASYTVGGKAENLFRLKKMGMNVPGFVVILAETLETLIPEQVHNAGREAISDYIRQVNIPKAATDHILAAFPNADSFAVRSSATDEDGTGFSFAGQFESHLYVTGENLATKIKSVWGSAYSHRVAAYRKQNNLDESSGIAVIIQEMVAAEASGVGFGANPINGNTDEKTISSVFGLGEGLVSGELDSDNFTLSAGQIKSHTATKTHKVIRNTNGGGVCKAALEIEKQNALSLSNEQVTELGEILDRLFSEYGKPMDIEFAFRDGKLYLLQARPITGISKTSTPSGTYRLWDNSNIVESYPGVTTPLTFSFISKSYEGAYRIFCGYMGVSQKSLRQNERVFANTLGLINGRVYYNLKTWYHMLAMLPGYTLNARFMENMMGVKERFDVPESLRLSKGKAWVGIAGMAVKMYVRFLTLPRKRKAFTKLLDQTVSRYKQIDYRQKDAGELMDLYLEFEDTLLEEWKAPLINDFFAMIWFGLLQKRCAKYGISSNPNIHNDLLCGSNDIISTQPIHRCINLSTLINSDKTLKDLFIAESPDTIWIHLCQAEETNLVSLKTEIDSYIADFGERCIGELKLETVSYTQNPALFVKVLKAYVETGITEQATSGNIEAGLRSRAVAEMNAALKYRPLRKWRLRGTLKNTRDLVSSRENLRYGRTRAFGVVREIFSHIGQRFHSEDLLESPRDIFYLTKEEIFACIEGTAVTQQIKPLIALRKAEYEIYASSEPPSERFATYGTVYNGNDFYSTEKAEKLTGDLKGIGCCPGRVKAKVMVINDPGAVSSLDGCILVTSSTDPGWVTLFPSASGIIVERGSLLSHSAIVSREMGKPCIVSVPGLLKTLKSGDEVEMDGSTGEIKIITPA